MSSVSQENSNVVQLKRTLKIQIIMDKALVCIIDIFHNIFVLHLNSKGIRKLNFLFCNIDIFYSVQNMYLHIAGHKEMSIASIL